MALWFLSHEKGALYIEVLTLYQRFQRRDNGIGTWNERKNRLYISMRFETFSKYRYFHNYAWHEVLSQCESLSS